MSEAKERKTHIFSKGEIDALFEDATEQGDYIVGYFKTIYGDDWEAVDHLDDFAHAGEELASYYMQKAIEWDEKYVGDGVLKGGAALNYGPSTDKTLAPWEATIPEVVWKEEEEGDER